jgi:tetratricopeptide (TPR) repeat protein
VSHLLELLGHGLGSDLGDLLDRYFWSPQSRSLEELRSGCEEHPDWPDMQMQLGLAYLRGGQVDDAVTLLRRACRSKPDYLAARLALASAYEHQGQVSKALDELQIAHQNHPGEVPLLFAIGFCLERLERPDEALECYRDAVEHDETFTPARERIAALAVLRDDHEEATTQYEALRRIWPEKAWVRSALAHLYHRAGKPLRAIEEYETAIAMEPENWSLLDDEVEALVESGQIRDAIERLHTLIEAQGPFADLHCRLGTLYSQVGDDEASTKHYLMALEQQPDYLEAKVKFGTHHLVCGRWEEAAEAFHDAAEMNDSSMLNYVGMGVAHLAAGRRADAMSSFDLAAALEPNSTILLAEMAKLQLKAAVADEYDRSFSSGVPQPVAEIALDNDDLLHTQLDRHAEQVERYPNRADVRYRFGVLLRAEGRLGEAQEQFAEAVEINPTYVQAVIKLAITQQELGQLDEAIETFQSVLDIHPQFVDLHYRLGLLHTDRRRFEDAVVHMEAAMEGAPDCEQIRAGLALSLQNMGLMDRAAATWRSLWKMHHAPNS